MTAMGGKLPLTVQHRPMHFRYLLPLLLLLTSGSETLAGSRNPPKLEGMGYDKARNLIMRYGWKPFPGECTGVDKDTCARYPELGNCQGVSPGYCDMSFAKDHRCLIVVTLESPPGTSKDDTWVKDVTFRRQPCRKDPA